MTFEERLRTVSANLVTANASANATSGNATASTSKLDDDIAAQAVNRRLVQPKARGVAARTTCIHTQLRDLLVCPNEQGEVVATSYQSMAKYRLPQQRESARGHRSRAGSRAASHGRREHLQSLSFIPNALSTGCGLLAAGGHHAELALRSSDSSSRWCIQTRVGRSINNSIYISPSPFHPLSVPRIYISNNDQSIYSYELHYPRQLGSTEITNEYLSAMMEDNDCRRGGGAHDDEEDSDDCGPSWASAPEARESQRYRSTLRQAQPVSTDPDSEKPELVYQGKTRLETPINHSSVSPDGRTLVAVGDTNQAFLFDVNDSGRLASIDTMEVSTDACFSTSWSRTGNHFAVASQDGSVSIFDLRSRTRPLRVFQTHNAQAAALASKDPMAVLYGASSTASYSSGAARVVKYSPGAHELLAFTEQRGYVHVVDARTYEYKEEICLPDVGLEQAARPVSPSPDLRAYASSPFTAQDVPDGRRRAALRASERLGSIATRHPLMLGRAAQGGSAPARLATTASATARSVQPYIGSRSVVARDLNPWDTWGSDDHSQPGEAVRAGYPLAQPWLDAIGTNSAGPRSLLAVRALQAAADAGLDMDMDADEIEDVDDDDDEREDERDGLDGSEGMPGLEEREDMGPGLLDWCPPSAVDGSRDALERAHRSSGTRSSLSASRHGQEPALPSSHMADPALPPGLESALLHARHQSVLETGDRTVSEFLSALEGASFASSSAGPPASRAAAAAAPLPPSMFSVTGLDWDPTGNYLYASMDRIILEWSVNEGGRRCIPSASIL